MRRALVLITAVVLGLSGLFATAAHAAPGAVPGQATGAPGDHPTQPSAEQRLKVVARADGQALAKPGRDGKTQRKVPAPRVEATPQPNASACTPSRSAGKPATPRPYSVCIGEGRSKPKLTAGPSGDGIRINGLTAAPAAEVLPLPQFCIDHAFQGWVYFRTQACSILSRTALIVDEEDVLVGTIDYLEINYSYTAADIQTWAHQIEIRTFGGTGVGLLPGTMVEGLALCVNFCTTVKSDFPPQSAANGQDAAGEGFFDSLAVVPGLVAFSFTTWEYTFSNPAFAPLKPASVSAPRVRCDDALPGQPSPGCVFPDYVPVEEYDRDGAFPELARHIGDAQASGLPGGYPNGPPLNRLTDDSRISSNRNRACPQFSSGGYPRPPTKSCDEYPFASSYQGASTAVPQGNARTFDWCQINEPSGTGPVGYSVCMIDAVQNSSGGSDLGSFYRNQRVLDNDQFYVWITGTGGGPNPNPPDFPPTADAGPDVSGFEGSPVDLVGSASDDHGPPAVHWSYRAGPDVDPGTVCFFGDDTKASTTIRCTDDGTFTVTISASDGIHDEPTTDSATVRLVNVPPQLRRATADLAPGVRQAAALPPLGIIAPTPWQVFRVGDPVTVTTNFEDPGTNDTQTCDLRWDDGTSSAGTVADSACGGTHVYTHAGMYTIRPSITDDDGGVSEPASVLVIVYDPAGGFATEGGFFNSPAGALTADPAAAGKLTLEFNPHYLPGDTGPAVSGGKVAATLQGGAFSLDSTTLDWLVVTPDNKVAVKGTGTVNGQPGYGFVAYGFNDPDAVRLVVWPLDSGPYPAKTLTYDNRAGADYDLDVSNPQPLDGGSLQIHN